MESGTKLKIFNFILTLVLGIELLALYYNKMLSAIMPWGGYAAVIIVAALFLTILALKLSDNVSTSISAVILIIIMTISGLFAPEGTNYLIIFISMILFFIVLGILINQRLPGILIDEKNQMSLSRFQMVIWTAIILSGFLTIALARIAANVPNALDIGMDWQLWALLGISTTSLVGTPLITAQKEEKTITPKEEKLFEAASKGEDVMNIGIVAVNKESGMASLSDMFKGDETATYKTINMAKVQMFFFTIIVALTYGLMLYNLIAHTTPSEIDSFPVLSDSIIAILAISHAGYLTNKTIDQTGTK